ncbi:MAG: hypothetical protein ABI901_08670, partial [Roseiflexaceae bacterium]
MRGTFGLGWWRNATVAGKLALWMGIALLLAAPLPGMRSAIGLADASAASADRTGVQPLGDALRLAHRAHPPTPTIAPQAADSTLGGRVVDPAGMPFTSVGSPNPAAGISAIGLDGTYAFANLVNDGSFSIALEA